MLTWENDKFLISSLAFSLAAHAVALSLRFIPESKPWVAPSPTIVAVLVNSKTAQAPKNPAFIAQASQDAGGETEEKNRSASSPTPKAFQMQSLKTKSQETPEQAKRRVESMEREVSRMMELAARSKLAEPQPKESASAERSADQESQKLALDLAARIDKQLSDYASRPKKVFVGASAIESDFAVWVESWQRRVEDVGNKFYPEQAKGKTRGVLILTAGVAKNGAVESVQIDKSSGYPLLDASAKRILELSGPFDPFTEPMRKKADVLYITRQWRFGPSGLAGVEAAQ